MICVSTRGKAPSVSLKEAVLAGLAPDGGLYVPANLEPKPDSWWSAQRGKSFQDLSIAIATALAGDEIDHGTLVSVVRAALNFPVRVVELERGLGVVELFHGPTFAFKDFGARMLAQLIQRIQPPAWSEAGGAAGSGGRGLTILVATSGDTGSAVAQAFFGVDGIRVVVMYPDGQVSAVQEAQFTTLGGNVTAVAVQGSFDDCQRLAKEAFADQALQARVRLTSANSISLGRLLPQIFYHAYAAVQYKVETPITISVPSGNFGNLVAGVLARKLGAPITHFCAPTTVNDTVPRYFASGRVEPRPSVRTTANSMDVGDPSNLERLQWLFGGDVDAMRQTITTKAFADDDVKRAIGHLYKEYGYIADPHTAIAYLGAQGALSAQSARGAQRMRALFMATAHPAKFREIVEPVIGQPVALPEPLAATLARKKVVQRISPALDELSKLL